MLVKVLTTMVYIEPGLKVPTIDIHWIREDLKLQIGESLEVMSRIRYRQPLEKAILHQKIDGLYIIFENDQKESLQGNLWFGILRTSL